MAAKKTTSKSAASKGKAKPAVKTSKPKPAAKKAAPAKKTAAPAKKPVAPAKKTTAPAKKTAAPAKKTAAPAKKAAPLKKSAAPAPKTKMPKSTAKPATAPKSTKPSAPSPARPEKKSTKAPATKSKSAAPKTGSSVVATTPPPAPVKPPFVPPKSPPAPPAATSGGTNGAHHSPAFIQKQRQRLLDLRDELVDAMSGMTRDTIRNAPEGSEASGSGQHQGDAGSDAYDRDFALSVLAKEQDALYEIEQALRRIQAGAYGICEISSRKIPQARLEAIPFARLTVECQAQWEKEYGKRRFRPSNEVGFSGGNYIDDEDSETVSLDEDDD
jgi:RNA polymerase-binding transcription factor DksA